ncbi:hypothetical protein [Zunongwangia profunda]|uniref:hypothetical protein n=1 Tax=Zunongwangia profunda TaxID=398743 RepID=UPI00248DD8AB|nr:hypothetical protein [Zunongwangia profunda]|tara:strand:- start:9489 stop:9836 length:348 start_codon:yes stop_codon:yes gene_type:complete
MIDTAVEIKSKLSHPDINSLFSEPVFWELAEEKTKYPFGTYSFTDGRPLTKEGLRDTEVKIRIFANNLTEASTIAKTVRDTISVTTNWKDRGGRSGYTSDEAKAAFLELTYEFKF